MAELHPQLRDIVGAPALSPATDAEALAAARADYAVTAARLGGAAEPVTHVEDVAIPRPGAEPLGARAYWPAGEEPVGALVWFHGGGWFVGDLDGFDSVSRSLCNRAGAIVLSVDYRLAPEHPFPAAVEDADLAVAWASGAEGAGRLGHAPGLVAVGGDSAGGNLAAVASLHARQALRAQLLVYPALDPAMDTPSFRELADFPVLTSDAVAFCWRTYLGKDGAAAHHPDASPLRAGDLAGAPPAYVAVAGWDVLRDEGVAYAEALAAAAVPVMLRRYDDMVHGFLRWGGVVDRAGELIAELGAFARDALRLSTGRPAASA